MSDRSLRCAIVGIDLALVKGTGYAPTPKRFALADSIMLPVPRPDRSLLDEPHQEIGDVQPGGPDDFLYPRRGIAGLEICRLPDVF